MNGFIEIEIIILCNNIFLQDDLNRDISKRHFMNGQLK